MPLRVTARIPKLGNSAICQVGKHTFFTINHSISAKVWTRILKVNVKSESYSIERAGFIFRQNSYKATLSNFKDKFVFMIGGAWTKSVSRYNLDKNLWQEMP